METLRICVIQFLNGFKDSILGCFKFIRRHQNLNKQQQQQLASQFDLFGGNAVAAAAAAAAAAGIPTPAIFGIMDSYFAAKMADRVTCDICNKQVN